MNTASKLSLHHKFTKGELYDILLEAFSTFKDKYWESAYSGNPLMDMGAYFNMCVRVVAYKDSARNVIVSPLVAVRVLVKFSEFSKVQLPVKKKVKISITISEKPCLNP